MPGTSWFDNYIKRFVDFWHEFLEGKSTDMSFYIENHLEHTPEMLSRVLTGINRKNVKACLDIGHAHCHSKVSVVERIKVLQDQIGYVHMHDNHGKEDEHLGLGQGNMSLVAVCKALEKYAPDAIWAPEAKAQWLQESIDRLKENKFL